jgi:bacitracin synthase 3
MLPAYYKQLDKMPQLANGKINKKALRTMIDAGMSSGVEYVAPRNETESKLVKIWEEILQRDKIGVNDNFFDLGGHSLKATTMANKIKHVFKVNITLKEIFKTPEIEKIGEEIQKKKWLYESKKADVKLTEEREVIRL